jgi:hypothetical protein
VCKWKNETCGNCSRHEGRGVKEMGDEGELKYDAFDTL